MSDGPAPYTVSSLDNLAAGNYLLQASLSVENMMFDFGSGDVECQFYADVQGGALVSPYGYMTFQNNSSNNINMNMFDRQSLTITYALEGLSGGTYDKIDFKCRVNGILDLIIDGFTMSATKVDTLVRQ